MVGGGEGGMERGGGGGGEILGCGRGCSYGYPREADNIEVIEHI